MYCRPQLLQHSIWSRPADVFILFVSRSDWQALFAVCRLCIWGCSATITSLHQSSSLPRHPCPAGSQRSCLRWQPLRLTCDTVCVCVCVCVKEREVGASGWGLYRFCFMALSTEVVLFVATAMRKEIKLTWGFQADTLIWSSPNPLVPAAPLQVMSLNPPYLPPRPAALVFEQWPLSGPWTDARLCNCLSLTRTLFPFVTVCARDPFGSTAVPRSVREEPTWWAPNLRLLNVYFGGTKWAENRRRRAATEREPTRC